MHHWATTRGGKILLLGTLCLLLQQVDVPYRMELWGDVSDASLVHLQAGLLLAIAMLDRDRWVLPGCYLLVIVGWSMRALAFSYPPSQIGIGVVISIAGCLWTWLCARGMGRPQPPEHEPMARGDLLRFVLYGLLAYPVGLALLALLYGIPEGIAESFGGVIQILFAKYFGVVVVTLPVVMLWTERRRPVVIRYTGRWPLWPVMGLGLVLSVVLGSLVRDGLGTESTGALVLTDYRIAALAVMAWCMLYLRLIVAMPLLSGLLLMMVSRLGDTATLSHTPLGFFNLVHLSLELGIVLMALFYYLVANRDRADLSHLLDEQAQRDSLTGLPNLRALRRQAAQRPHTCELACLLLDQADTLAVGYGLGAQSSVMNAVAARLEAQGVQPCYLGSGQFALLAECGREIDWTGVLHDIEQPGFLVEGRNVRLLPYLGVARFGGDTGLDMDAALMQASSLAFEARGNNEVEPLYADATQATLRQAQERMHGASQVLALLRRPGGLQLYFQPLVALNAQPLQGRSVGEVLCRLSDEQGNLLAPNLFLPAVEAARRGPELDLAVVTELFAQLRQAPELAATSASIAINLTGQSLASGSFRLRLLELLEQAPLRLSRLCFEITETVAIFTAEQASLLLDELRVRGCRIAIDDFGVGMQSFARLKELPVDIIKIDGSFVRNLTRDPRDYAMVQASVAVARACGAEVVAEYVEDEDTAACLRKLGVHWGQGYLYARPMPLREGLCWTCAQADGVIREDAEPQPQMNLL
ncbi:MAG: EAL domain-containing protein [Stenotrophomonas sp.]